MKSVKRTTISRCGFAALQCGEAPPQRQCYPLISEAVPRYRLLRRRSLQTTSLSIGKAKPYRTGERRSRRGRKYRFYGNLVVLLVLVSLASCSATQKQVGIPSEAQVAIDAVSEDIATGQDEKIYQEAADEWRQASTLEQTKEFFKTLRTKLGKMKTRTFHAARGEQNKSGASPEQTFVVQYETVFERAEGMETFTLVERNGRWLLARYFVNSDALK